MKNLIEATLDLQAGQSLASKDDMLSLFENNISLNGEIESDFIENIKQRFPILTDSINISGSKEAINLFKKLSIGKYDYNFSLKDFKVNRFFDKENKIDFTISENGTEKITGVTTYEARQNFLEKFFKMNKFADFAFSENQYALVLDNITQLTNYNPDEEARYRFIDIESNTYLRAVVDSKRYKPYDNYIVLYLSLIAMNKMAVTTKQKMRIFSFFITDSKLELTIVSQGSEKIADNLYISTGIHVSNSEIRDGSVNFEISYVIQNDDGEQLAAIGERVASISHNLMPEHIQDRLSKLNDLADRRSAIISTVKRLNFNKKLNDDEIYVALTTIGNLNTKLLTKKAKEEILNTDANELISTNGVTLFEVFGHLKEVMRESVNDPEIVFQARFSQLTDRIIRSLK